jgi:hypothetical protein
VVAGGNVLPAALAGLATESARFGPQAKALSVLLGGRFVDVPRELLPGEAP